MQTIIVEPRNQIELQLISDMLKKMRIEMKVLSEEEQEEIGLIKLLKEVDRTKKVSRSKVMEKFGKR